MRIFLSVLVLLFACPSCEKVSMGCDMTVETFTQATKEAKQEIATRMSGYLFYADTLFYTVSSFDDAQNGIMTHKASAEKIKYDQAAVFDETTKRLEFKNANQPQCVLLLVDPLSQTFAYKGQQVAENSPTLQLSVTFKLWLIAPSKLYYENKWHFGKQ